MAAARYTKGFMPLSKVKEKEFLSRPMGCKGVGFSFVRYKPGEGATYVHRHKVQEEVFITLKGTGSIILDGKRVSMPEGTVIRVGPTVYRALGNDSKKDVVYRSDSAEKLSAWRENLARRWHPQSEEGAALEKIGASSSSGASGTWADNA
jgi:uncharacterized cupin superfamily protein